VPLEEQDRSLWDREQIDEGVALLDDVLRRGGAGPYRIQAAIAACHATAPSFEETPWREIAALYARLERFVPSDVVRLDDDRRGRGGSGDTPPYAVEREIEDLAAVVEAAGGAAAVFGNSSGAVLAPRAAAAGLPITRLALWEPPLQLDAGAPDRARAYAAELSACLEEGRRLGRGCADPLGRGSGHLHRVGDDRVEQVTHRVEPRGDRLHGAGLVGGAGQQLRAAGTRVGPGDLPARPGAAAAAVEQPGVPPAGPAVGAHLDAGDPAAPRPRPAAQPVRPSRRDARLPAQLERALGDLPGERRAALVRVAGPEEAVVDRVPR
jgi:hypothetical protein